MQDKKKIGLIVTLVTVFVCGCPGLFIILATMYFGYSDARGTNAMIGVVVLVCMGLFLVLIPLLAGGYTFLQSRKVEEIESIEVPPAL